MIASAGYWILARCRSQSIGEKSLILVAVQDFGLWNWDVWGAMT